MFGGPLAVAIAVICVSDVAHNVGVMEGDFYAVRLANVCKGSARVEDTAAAEIWYRVHFVHFCA